MSCDTFPVVIVSADTGTGAEEEEEGRVAAAAAAAAADDDDEGTGKVVTASASASVFSTVPSVGSWTGVPTGIDVEVSPVTPEVPKGTVPAHTLSISVESSFT